MIRWNEEGLRAALLALSLPFAAGCGEALAGPPRGKDKDKDYDRSASSAAPSVSALPPEPEVKLIDGHKPWVPAFDVAIPEAASEAPAKEEWATAPAAREVRVTDPGCKAQRIREWYRLTCASGQRIELISGEREGVSFGCWKTARDTDFCDEVWMVFPARRGDRRALEVLRWGKWSPEPNTIATEQFLEGDPYPLISMQGIRWGF